MQFTIINRNDQQSSELAKRVRDELKRRKLIFDEKNPELIIVIGGDGTVLNAIQKYIHSLDEVCFVGIHTGNLGFYLDWQVDELEMLIDKIVLNEYYISEFPILESKVYFDNQKEKTYLALNEMTISDSRKTFAVDVYIDDIFFEAFRGTGFCAATPSGSTAYNKSLGGAIIHPKIKSFQLTEMASINNKLYRTIGSPLIFGQEQKVRLVMQEPSENVIFTNDAQVISGESIQTVELSVSQQNVRFIRYRPHRFWSRVKNAFI